MLKKLMMTTAAAAFAVGLAVSTPAYADVPESEDPIIIVQNNWTSQLVLSTVVGKVLQGMGGNGRASQRAESESCNLPHAGEGGYKAYGHTRALKSTVVGIQKQARSMGGFGS